MARVVSATTQTEIAKPVTLPIYLIQLVFSSTIRYSTYGDVTWNGNSWAAISGPPDSEAVDIETSGSGSQAGRILLDNFDNTLSAVVLNESVSGKSCDIWQLYGEGPYAVDDAEHVFSGVVDAIPDIGDFVEFEIVSEGRQTQLAPRLVCSAPLCNHIPPRRSIIEWGGEHFQATNRSEDRDDDEEGEND